MSKPAPIKRLPRNPNLGTDRGREALRRSVERLGWTDPGVISSDNVALSGNHRLDLANELGTEPLIIDHDGKRPLFVRLPVKSGTPAAFMVATAANRVAQLNQNIDVAEVAAQASEYGVTVESLHYTDDECKVEVVHPDGPASPPATDGRTRDEIGRALRESGLAGAGSEEAESEPPPRPGDEERESPPERPAAPERCKPGDLWELGDHRLLIGDCRNTVDVGRLLDGARVNLCFTSPPYGGDKRDYDESSGFRPIPTSEYVAWFQDVQKNVYPHLAADGSFCINIKEGVENRQRSLYVKDVTIAMVRLWGWMLIDEFVWERPGNPGSWPNRFKNGFEPVFHFARRPEIKFFADAMAAPSDRCIDEGGDRRGRGTGTDYGAPEERRSGLALPSNVVRTQVSSESWHEAAFPVDLPRFFVRSLTAAGDVVYDPFCGSGTTLLACEESGRRGVGIELSPRYGDACLARFERATGKQVRLLSRVS